MYRPLAHGEFKEGGGLCKLESWRRLPERVRIEGREEWSLGKKPFGKESIWRYEGGQRQREEMAPGDFTSLAPLILVATTFFPSQWGWYSVWLCGLSLTNDNLSWDFCLICWKGVLSFHWGYEAARIYAWIFFAVTFLIDICTWIQPHLKPQSP